MNKNILIKEWMSCLESRKLFENLTEAQLSFAKKLYKELITKMTELKYPGLASYFIYDICYELVRNRFRFSSEWLINDYLKFMKLNLKNENDIEEIKELDKIYVRNIITNFYSKKIKL